MPVNRGPSSSPRNDDPATAPVSASPVTGAKGLSVLVVDDMSETRELFCLYFEMQGVRVRMAADGIAALKAILAETPDVIVLDLAMPRMTGWEFIRLVRQDERMGQIPIVTLSGQGAQESAMQAGANAYLEKPCLPADVLAAVRRVAGDGASR